MVGCPVQCADCWECWVWSTVNHPMQIPMLKITARALALAVVVATAPAMASPYPQTSQTAAERDLRCYMHLNNSSRSLDLTSICNNLIVVPGAAGSSPVSSSSSTTVSGGTSGSGSSSSSGPCNFPTDRDSLGRLCGGRAASERPGGR